MHHARIPGTVERVARFESFEPRLFLSLSTTTDDTGLDGCAQASAVEFDEWTLDDASAASTTPLADCFRGIDASRQTIAVIDSGIAYSHDALGGGLGETYRVVGGHDFAERDADPCDDGLYGSHGTHVAGIIGSDDPRHPGIAPEADLVALRVFDDQGMSDFTWVEQALQWVHDHRFDFENPITTVNLSLGNYFNGDSPPSWASLEDELAQLEADGIFIAVAAGNNFSRFQEVGVSYPAASPYVVPVGSVDATGLLSSFSQRDERIIAAPGRDITSTVPDYMGNYNGRDDDYATYTGTSMAAPYVAGASALLREAFAFAGTADVDQNDLYSVMHATADSVYDSVTRQSYRRLNLDRAVENVLPGDDYGSTLAAAHRLGTIADTFSLDGTIGRTDDVDHFQFTADFSGTMTVALDVDTTWGMTADWQLSDLTDYVISDDGLQLTFDVTAGEDYRLGLGTGAGVGHYRLSFAGAADALPEVVDLDTITQARFDGQAFTVDGAYYAATAARHGLFTVEALFNDAAATTAQLELYDAAWNRIATGVAASSDAGTGVIHRADVTLAAGETLFVRIAGGEAATAEGRVDLRLTNLLSVDDDEATLFGTPGADDVTLRMGATHLLSIGGVEYAIDADRVTSINVLTDGDHDTLVLYGTDADEHIRLAVGGVVMVGDGWTATALGVEEITVHGGGGRDVGELHDSVAADTFTARPGWAEMVGGGYHNRLFGADDVHAHATHGGSDVARLYDSLGNDALTADPTSARLDGTGFRLEASGFSQVHAYSLGGQDTATLRDSAGDDRLTADATQAVLEGAGFLNRARGFEQVTVRATGGDDRAELHDSVDDDVLVARPTSVALFTPTTTVQVLAFDRVDAFSTQGDDVARLIDSAENDRFTAAKGQSTMIGPGYHNCVVGFGETHGYAVHGGLDTAVLLRSGDSDSFQTDGDVARLTGDGFDLRAAYFEQLSADAQDGTDQARLADSPGDDHSAAARITATLEASRATVWALAFESITASPNRGGHDRAEIAAVDYALELMGDCSPG